MTVVGLVLIGVFCCRKWSDSKQHGIPSSHVVTNAIYSVPNIPRTSDNGDNTGIALVDANNHYDAGTPGPLHRKAGTAQQNNHYDAGTPGPRQSQQQNNNYDTGNARPMLMSNTRSYGGSAGAGAGAGTGSNRKANTITHDGRNIGIQLTPNAMYGGGSGPIRRDASLTGGINVVYAVPNGIEADYAEPDAGNNGGYAEPNPLYNGVYAEPDAGHVRSSSTGGGGGGVQGAGPNGEYADWTSGYAIASSIAGNTATDTIRSRSESLYIPTEIRKDRAGTLTLNASQHGMQFAVPFFDAEPEPKPEAAESSI